MWQTPYLTVWRHCSQVYSRLTSGWLTGWCHCIPASTSFKSACSVEVARRFQEGLEELVMAVMMPPDVLAQVRCPTSSRGVRRWQLPLYFPPQAFHSVGVGPGGRVHEVQAVVHRQVLKAGRSKVVVGFPAVRDHCRSPFDVGLYNWLKCFSVTPIIGQSHFQKIRRVSVRCRWTEGIASHLMPGCGKRS